jgi:hypothetical protein
MSRPSYFTPAEIAMHNCAEDIWVSFLGITVNLTPLAEKLKGACAEPIFASSPDSLAALTRSLRA